MQQVKISSKNQITIPKTILEKLNIKSGNKIIIEPSYDKIILRVPPKDLIKYYSGIAKKSFEKLGGGEAYLKKERDSWKK